MNFLGFYPRTESIACPLQVQERRAFNFCTFQCMQTSKMLARYNTHIKDLYNIITETLNYWPGQWTSRPWGQAARATSSTSSSGRCLRCFAVYPFIFRRQVTSKDYFSRPSCMTACWEFIALWQQLFDLVDYIPDLERYGILWLISMYLHMKEYASDQ